MSTTIAPKKTKTGVNKKASPKTKAAARRATETLVADETRRPSQTSTTLPDGVAALDPDVAEAGLPLVIGDVVKLPCEKLVRHPLNRKPLKEEIEARAESFKTEGQLEPIVVRVLEVDPVDREVTRWQILSGETRWHAANRNQWETIDARIIENCSDSRALELVAQYNGERTDLNPIQKAALIENLCKPVAEGGSGNTREQAARAVGLKSASAASNLVRLLDLPEVWRERVISGDLPESFARLLIPIAPAPSLLKLLEKDWKVFEKCVAEEDFSDPDVAFTSRGALEHRIKLMIREETRPADPKQDFHYGYDELGGDWNYHGRFTTLFEMTDELRVQLEIFDLPVMRYKRGKEVAVIESRVTNVALYDKLQIPLIKKQVDGRKKTKASKSAAGDEPQAKKELTPAEQKKLAAERQKKLEARLREWRHRWLCTLVARRLENYPDAARALLCYLLTKEGGWSRTELAEAALIGIGETRASAFDADKLLSFFVSQENPANWIQLAIDAMGRHALMKPDRNREYLALDDVIEGLARWCEVDLAEEWIALQRPSPIDGVDVDLETFFGIHSAEQLDELGGELGIFTEGVSAKAAKLKLFLVGGTRTLPFPSSIKPLVEDPQRKARKQPAAVRTAKKTKKKPAPARKPK